MKLIKIYKLISEVREELKHLVEPVVTSDVRLQRSKLLEIMELIEEHETNLIK